MASEITRDSTHEIACITQEGFFHVLERGAIDGRLCFIIDRDKGWDYERYIELDNYAYVSLRRREYDRGRYETTYGIKLPSCNCELRIKIVKHEYGGRPAKIYYLGRVWYPRWGEPKPPPGVRLRTDD